MGVAAVITDPANNRNNNSSRVGYVDLPTVAAPIIDSFRDYSKFLAYKSQQ